ncbi:hypothetical protein EYF80_026569 [Liparis tanakae]|uniref:Uncharacterized protein n=1 Tax=Liparis tanakae TaxID=230148 RepID=A0A4Z2HBT9_9TELE|nr:hypothetical protein EYF80_026569 [Liparis tanakae]
MWRHSGRNSICSFCPARWARRYGVQEAGSPVAHITSAPLNTSCMVCSTPVHWRDIVHDDPRQSGSTEESSGKWGDFNEQPLHSSDPERVGQAACRDRVEVTGIRAANGEYGTGEQRA